MIHAVWTEQMWPNLIWFQYFPTGSLQSQQVLLCYISHFSQRANGILYLKKKVITLLFPVSEFPHMISGTSICHSVILSSYIFLIQGTCYSNSPFLTICSKFNCVNLKDLVILEIILYNIENRTCLFPEIHCYNLRVL